MSWLIEAFLDEDYFEEEMRTAADFRKKKEEEREKRYEDTDNAIRRDNAKFQAGNKYYPKSKDLPKHNMDNYEKATNYLVKNHDDLNSRGTRQQWLSAKDSVERRIKKGKQIGSDTKPVNASADIVELFQ